MIPEILLPESSWGLLSPRFALTFIAFFALYLLLCRFWPRQRAVMLTYVTAFSLFFAYKASGLLAVFLPLTALVSWLLTAWMRRLQGWRRKAVLTLTVTVVFAPLLYYKYAHFTLQSLNDLLATNFPLPDLLLPAGISFYTFQAVSYVVDVFRGRFTLRASLLEYFFYLTFFPLLTAGPITRAETLIPQLRRTDSFGDSRELPYSGLWLVLSGILKKVVVADYLAQFTAWVFDAPTDYSGFECLMGVVGYTLQIYLDFSGYSDIAIGTAALLGFRLKENFRLPYQSQNLTEFWRRWHIALSTWFRDYLYIPLGGNRHGKLRMLLGCFVTMVAAGLWHGAAWQFVIWGAMHGVGLVVHKTLKPILDAIPDTPWVKFLSWMLTFLYVMLAWVFFRAESFDAAFALLRYIAADFSWDYLQPFVRARFAWTLLLLLGFAHHLLRQRHTEMLREAFVRAHWTLKLLLTIATLQLALNFSQEAVAPFIYEQF